MTTAELTPEEEQKSSHKAVVPEVVRRRNMGFRRTAGAVHDGDFASDDYLGDSDGIGGLHLDYWRKRGLDFG